MAVAVISFWAALLWRVCYGNQSNCVSPKSSFFKSCGRDKGAVTSPPIHALTVTSDSECVLHCVNSVRCVAVAVQTSARLSERNCELFSAPQSCDNVGNRVDHQFYVQGGVYRPCVTRSPAVRGAVRAGAVYTLFTESTLQEFILDGTSLYAVDCPLQTTTAFSNWRTGLQVDAAAYSSAFGANRLFIVHNDTVVEGFLKSKVLVEFEPPKNTSTFFGAGISGSIRAVVADGDKFHVYTENGIYTSVALSFVVRCAVVSLRQPQFSPEFNWIKLTAATLTSDNDVMLLFFGDSYVLYDSVNRSVVGRGEVCTNSFPELMPES